LLQAQVNVFSLFEKESTLILLAQFVQNMNMNLEHNTILLLEVLQDFQECNSIWEAILMNINIIFVFSAWSCVKTYKDVVVVYNSNKTYFHIWAQCDMINNMILKHVCQMNLGCIGAKL